MTTRPRVIRKVTKLDRKQQPKAARDRKTFIEMERVTARAPRPCAYHRCKDVIEVGEAYAKVTRMDAARRMGSLYVPDTKDYHVECVPPEAHPLVRFLFK